MAEAKKKNHHRIPFFSLLYFLSVCRRINTRSLSVEKKGEKEDAAAAADESMSVCVCVCVIIYLKFHFVAPVFSFFISPSVRCTAAQEKKENVLHVVIFIICDFARQASSIVKKKAGDSFFFF